MSGDLLVLPVTGLGDVRPGDDLADLIAGAAPWIADGDVVVVTSKIVSKSEGRLAPVPAGGPARDAARDAILAAQTARVVATRGHTRIVVTHHGFVMAAAGIDASNVDREHLVLLPVDPDASARALRAALRTRHGWDVAIVISDTMGRTWRTGQTDVALGVAGLDPIRDYRGEIDAYGNELHITQVAVVDELCAAAELVKGKHSQVPVAVIRGLDARGLPDGPGIGPLLRDAGHDMFPLGTAEARAAGLREAAAPLRPADRAAPLARALHEVGSGSLHLLDRLVREKLRDQLPGVPDGELIAVAPPEPGTLAAARAGADVIRLRAVLASYGLVGTWLDEDLSEVIPDGPPLGVIAVVQDPHGR